MAQVFDHFFLLKMPEKRPFLLSSLRSFSFRAVCMDIGRSMSDSSDTDGRGGGGGAILRAVNFEEVVDSFLASGSPRRVVETNLPSLGDVGCLTSTYQKKYKLSPKGTAILFGIIFLPIGTDWNVPSVIGSPYPFLSVGKLS